MTPDFIAAVQRSNTQLAESNEPLAQFLTCEVPSPSEISEMLAASLESAPETIIGAEANERFFYWKGVLYKINVFTFHASLAMTAACLLSLPRNAERTVTFRALVDAKGAAERACRLRPMPLGSRTGV